MKNYLTGRNNDLGFSFFEDAFNDFFKPVSFSRKFEMMKTDVKESEKCYELAIDMPGFDKKDIKVDLSNGYLTVSAEKQEKENDGKYIRQERSCSCQRSYYVGENITEEDVKAKYDNGTLMVEIPKKDEKQLPNKHIEIQ